MISFLEYNINFHQPLLKMSIFLDSWFQIIANEQAVYFFADISDKTAFIQIWSMLI